MYIVLRRRLPWSLLAVILRCLQNKFPLVKCPAQYLEAVLQYLYCSIVIFRHNSLQVEALEQQKSDADVEQ